MPYTMFLLQTGKEMKNGKILSADIWRWLGLLSNRCLPCNRMISSETDRGSFKNWLFFEGNATCTYLLHPSQEYFQARNIPRSDARHRNQKITTGFLSRKRFPPRVVQSCSDSFSSLAVDDPHAAIDFFSTTTISCVTCLDPHHTTSLCVACHHHFVCRLSPPL